jgi:hypothetical protein
MSKLEIFGKIIKYGFYFVCFLFLCAFIKESNLETFVKTSIGCIVGGLYVLNRNIAATYAETQRQHRESLALLQTTKGHAEEAAKCVGYMYNIESQRIKEKYK